MSAPPGEAIDTAAAGDPPVQAEVRYVLSGQPKGWAAMAVVTREFDEEKIQDCKEDIDTLLVFVSRFSWL